MGKLFIEQESLKAIADAIRAKTGGSELLTVPNGMVSAIGGISGGGGNAQATLNALIDRSITEFESDITSIGQTAFSRCAKLTTVKLPNVTDIANYAFEYCSSLTSINLPSATTISSYIFYRGTALTSAYLPNIGSIGVQCFGGCSVLTKVIIGTNQTTVATLVNTSAFSSCYHILGTINSTYNPTGAKDGYIYAPHSLVADYRSATNWATYASQIMPYVATIDELANIDSTTYDKACVGADYVEYTYNGTSWELYTRS